MKVYIIVMGLFAVGMLLTRWLTTEPVRRIFGPGLAISYTLIAFTCFVGHNNWLLLAVCFGAFFIGVRSRLDAACRFIVLTVLTPHVTFFAGGAGLYFGEWQPVMAYALALALACLVFPKHQIGPARFGREDAVAIVFTLILMFGPTHAVGLTVLLRNIVVAGVALGLPYFLLTRSVAGRQELSLLLVVTALSGVLLATFACYEAVKGFSLFDNVWRSYEAAGFMSRNLRVRSGLLRVPTTFLGSTNYAVFAVLAMVVAVYSKQMFRTVWRWRLACGLLLVALVAAQSRGALIGLAAAAIVVPAVRRNYGRAVLLLAGAAIVAGNMLLLAQFSDRAASFVQADAALQGQDYRQLLLRRGFELALQHPIFGTGTADIAKLLPDLVQGEHIVDLVNSYITILLDAGFAGLFAFLIPLVMTGFKLRRMRIAARDQTGRQSLDATISVITSVLVTLFFTSLIERSPLWLLFGLACVKIAGQRTSSPVPAQRVRQDARLARPEPRDLVTG